MSDKIIRHDKDYVSISKPIDIILDETDSDSESAIDSDKYKDFNFTKVVSWK